MKSSTTWILLQFLLATVFLLLGCDTLAVHPKCHLVTAEKERVPASDVIVEVGSDIYIDCINNASQKNDSDQMLWFSNSLIVPSNLTEQISPDVLSLHFKNATVSQSGYYKCSYQSTGICFTNIKIGYKPLPVTNFSCTSYDLEYMECRWSAPYNPVNVNYLFVIVLSGNRLESNSMKPKRIRNTNNYIFNITNQLSPPYDRFKPYYRINLYGSNMLGNATWHFNINHFENVVPGKVTNLQANPLPDKLRTYRITFEKSEMMNYFHNDLLYRIEYKTQWSDNKSVMETTDAWADLEVEPYTYYTVNVSCLSSLANKTLQRMWSKPTTLVFQTPPDVPGAPPEIVPGSFYVNSFIDQTHITLYWKSIPKYLENGENFSYAITARSLNSGIETTLFTKHGHITFTNLKHSDDYNFVLNSQNENGTSQNNSSIIVGAVKSLMPKPRSITVIAYDAIHYYVTWLPPFQRVAGYRIFWVESNSTFAINDEGFLHWKDVDSTVNNTNITLAGKMPYYNFGVTSLVGANTSGIIWNTCIVRSNGVIGKMKHVSAHVPCSDSLTIQWNIDCAEKIGIITEYKVYYCPVKGENGSCIEGPVNETVQRNVDANNVVIGNLSPFTWYRITVSVVTKAGEGEHSDPIFARTSESKPDYAISAMEVYDITNNSFVIKWHPHNNTNGIITHYIVRYSTSTESYVDSHNATGILKPSDTYFLNISENVKPYTEYSVSIEACNSAGCSKPSTPKLITTEIGVPRQMNPPRVRLINSTFAVIAPDQNGELNGPKLIYDIKAVIIDSNNQSNEKFYPNLTADMKYVRVDCDAPELNGAVVEWQTRAINLKDSEVLVGDWSDYTKMNCFDTGFPVAIIIAIVVGSAIGLTILILFAVAIAKRVKSLINGPEISVVLPSNLNKESYLEHLDRRKGTIKNIDYVKSDLKNGAAKMLLGDDSRSRNISGDTTQSSGSTEELLMQSKDHRSHFGNDSIGSGNHDSLSSRPSTTQTQLSSESSLESVPSVPESPDSVFNDHPLNGITVASNVGLSINHLANNSGNSVFNPTLDRIEELNNGNASQSGTPLHYSKFAGYDESASNSPSNKRQGRGVQNGYVAAPYSKFGLGMMGESSNLGAPRSDSPVSPFSLEINDTDPPLMSYSKVGLSIPLFSDQQQPSNAFRKHFAATSSPIAPVHSVTGYSVLGLGRANPDSEANSRSFSQPPPAAMSSPVESASKGYVLAAAINNLSTPSCDETPDILTQQDCGTSLPLQSAPSSLIEGLESPNYTSMNAHKRSPSSASSLTAGYCRLALSRPTSLCSETDPNYVQAEPQSGSPVLTSCHNSALDMVSDAVSPSHVAGGSNSICSPSMHTVPVHATAVVGKSGLNGYATVQQLLKEKGNS